MNLKPNAFLFTLLFFISFAAQGQIRYGSYDPAKMVTREKLSLLKKLDDLSPDQRQLLDGIYDEYGTTVKERMDEAYKKQNWESLRDDFVNLALEKDKLIFDLLNEEQYQIYDELAEEQRMSKEGEDASHRSVVDSLKANDTPSVVVGKIQDPATQEFLPGATVVLRNLKDSSKTRYAITSVEGQFIIQNVHRAFYRLYITSVGHKTYTQTIRLMKSTDLGTIRIAPDTTMLKELVVEREVVAVEQKGDTILYNADAYKVNASATVADLVRKLPGMVIDENGVTANGEQIQQVLVDGKRFFGQDALLSLNALPAEIVDRVEVFDEKSEKAQFTGNDDGNTKKTINVVTKEDKRNGYFGNVYGGYATDERYKAGFNINMFKGNQRLSLLGMSNNINVQNFSDEALAEIPGGRWRYRNDANSGISRTDGLGLNYSNDLGSKGTIETSYFLNKVNNVNNQVRNRKTFVEGGTQDYAETRTSESDNINHRVEMNLEYNISEKDRLEISPSFNLGKSDGVESNIGRTLDVDSTVINRIENNLSNTSVNNNFSVSSAYMHRFNDAGRTVRIDGSTYFNDYSTNKNFSDVVLDSMMLYQTNGNSQGIDAGLSFIEPIGSFGEITIGYDYRTAQNESDKQTYEIDATDGSQRFNSTLSSKFDQKNNRHVFNLSFTKKRLGNFFGVGVNLERSSLINSPIQPSGEKTKRTYFNFLPSINGSMRFENESGINYFTYAYSQLPQVNQFQPVVDNSNPLFFQLGNPELDQTLHYGGGLSYYKTNFETNNTFSNYLNVYTNFGYIAYDTRIAEQDSVYTGGIIVREGTQISSPFNTNGYWSVNNNTTYSMSLTKLKSKFNTSVDLGYTRTPGRINDFLNYSNNYSSKLNLALISNISEKLDFTIYYNIRGNLIINTVEHSPNSHYISQTAGINSDITIGNGWVFRNHIYHVRYDGVEEAFDTNYTMWTLSVAKKVFKDQSGELEASVYDLLKQNQNVTQSVSATYLEEVRTDVLQQYFMLTFSYRLSAFKSSGG